jgi:4-amino-4-deoxy-L-arabinose transferase-like glycosyltransferase
VADRSGRTAALVLAAVTIFHVWFAGGFALSPQEAYYWQWSRHLAWSYFDHPPLAAWTIRAMTELFGDSERAIRLAAAFHSAAFSGFFFLAARRLFGPRPALAALAAGFAIPLFTLGQVIITPDGPLLSGWAMALYFTVRALDDERPAWLLAAGAAAGWAMLGKYTGALLLPQVLLVLALDPRGRRMLRTPWPWAGAALALLLFAPVVAWNLARHLESFAFQTTERAQGSSFRPRLMGGFLALQAALLTPVALVLAVDAVVAAFRRRAAPPWRVVLLFSAPLLVLAAVVSPFHWVKGNWLAAAWPTAIAGAAALALERPRRWRWWTAAIGVGIAAAATVYVHLVPVFPAVPFPAREEGSSGWTALAARVEEERGRLGPDAPVVGCNYKVASELAYYLPGRPETQSVGLLGERGLQYDEWIDWATVAGREALLVLDRREKNGCRKRETSCAALVPLEPLQVRRGEAVVTTFELWRCRLPEAPPAGLAAR